MLLLGINKKETKITATFYLWNLVFYLPLKRKERQGRNSSFVPILTQFILWWTEEEGKAFFCGNIYGKSHDKCGFCYFCLTFSSSELSLKYYGWNFHNGSFSFWFSWLFVMIIFPFLVRLCISPKYGRSGRFHTRGVDWKFPWAYLAWHFQSRELFICNQHTYHL